MAPRWTFPMSASGTPTRTLTGFSSTMEKTGAPAATVWPGSTLRMLMISGNRRNQPRVIQPLLFLARLRSPGACLRGCRGAIFLAKPFLSHLVALSRGVVRRLDLLEVVRRQALSLHQELHALVFVCPSFEVDAGLFEFLVANTSLDLLCGRQRRLLLSCRGIERVAVIGRFDFRQQLSFAHMLAFFDQHPGHAATDLESHISRF